MAETFEILVLALAGEFLGSSNVHLSHLFGLRLQTTTSHELFIGVEACINEYKTSTQVALTFWIESYGLVFFITT